MNYFNRNIFKFSCETQVSVFAKTVKDVFSKFCTMNNREPNAKSCGTTIPLNSCVSVILLLYATVISQKPNPSNF